MSARGPASERTERDKPHPLVTPLTEPYWQAAAEGRLVIQYCPACARYIHLPGPSCPRCHGRELEFRPVSGRGRVYTYSVVHRAFVPGFAAEVPYVIAWIELDEQAGLRAFGNVTGCDPAAVRIGTEVEAYFPERPGFGAMPGFRVVHPATP
jgi:hypothetical protein